MGQFLLLKLLLDLGCGLWTRWPALVPLPNEGQGFGFFKIRTFGFYVKLPK